MKTYYYASTPHTHYRTRYFKGSCYTHHHFRPLRFFLPRVNLSTEFATKIISYGVALLLFISGFVLHLNHPSFTQHNSLADFYKKRILRIFPLYWLAIALVCVEGYHFASPINAYALIGTQLTGFEIDIIQIFVGLPIVVLVAYLLQRAQNEIVSKVRKYRTASEPPPDRT